MHVIKNALFCEHVQSDFSEDQILGELLFNIFGGGGCTVIFPVIELFIYNQCLT